MPVWQSMHRFVTIIMMLVILLPVSGQAAEILVAVAANYFRTAEEIAQAYESRTGNTVLLVSGSTGRLYSQVVYGAPYDVFLGADDLSTGRLAEDGLAEPGSRRVYATGRLALVSPLENLPSTDLANVLHAAVDGRVAVANPETAPYGRAAIEVLEQLGLRERAKPNLVFGENVGQVYSYVMTGNVDYGLVALSHVHGRGSAVLAYAEIPEHLHAPIIQEAVLLKQPGDREAARDFHAFLFGDHAQDISMSHGYGAAR